MKRERVLLSLLLIVGLAFAFLGQFYLTYHQDFWRDALLFWGASALSFGLLLWRWRRRGRERSGEQLEQLGQRLLSGISGYSWRTLSAIGGVLLVLLAGWLAQMLPQAADFGVTLWLWLIGVACFLAAFVPSFSVRGAWVGLRHRLRQRRVELAGLAALLLAALLVRAVDLEHIPVNLGGDEGTQGLAALGLVEAPLGNPFSTGWFSVPTMSFLVYGVSMQVFGRTVEGLRMLSALIGTATVLATYLLARELWGRRAAWLVAVVLACSHYHVHFSRLGSNQIADGFFIALSLWLLARGVRLRRTVYFALAGAVVGLGWYGYFGARLIGAIVLLYLIWLAVREWRVGPAAAARVLTRYGRWLLALVGAALVVAAPLLLYYASNPGLMASRAQQVSILTPGWLEHEQAYYGVGAAEILSWQLWKSISAFHYTLDPTFWYRPSIPLLDFVSGVLLLLGMAWAVVRFRRRGGSLLLIWFWLALLLGWMLTENPPSSQRMVVIAPALALLVGLGLDWLMALGRRIFASGYRLWNGVTIVVLGVVAVINLHYYFVAYTPTRIYGNPNAEIATELGRYLARQDDGYTVYFHGPPAMYWDNGNLRFLAWDVPGVDVYPPGDGRTVEPVVAQGARFVFLSGRQGELGAIRERFPGGAEQVVYSEVDGRLLYVLYEVAPR